MKYLFEILEKPDTKKHKPKGGIDMKRLTTIVFFVAIGLLSIFVYAQDKNELLRAKRQKMLEDTPFDKVVLTTLVALEQNYQVKKRLLPLVHEDDYIAIILNTAKRIILAKEIRAAVNAEPDTTKAENQ